MICVIEVALLLLGLLVVVTGDITVGSNRVLRGTPAHILGGLLMVPLPLSLLTGLLVGAFLSAQGRDPTQESYALVFILIDVGIFVVCLLAIGGSALVLNLTKARRPKQGADFLPGSALWCLGSVLLLALMLLPCLVAAVLNTLVPALAPPPTQPPLAAQRPPGERPPERQGPPHQKQPPKKRPKKEPPQNAEQPGDPAVRQEVAELPIQVPDQVDDQLQKAGAKVFLSDLPEFAVKPGPHGWKFAKGGKLGTIWQKDGGIILVVGKTYPKGLSLVPPDNTYTRVCYFLDGHALSVQGAVALSEDEPHHKPNPTRFVILGGQ